MKINNSFKTLWYSIAVAVLAASVDGRAQTTTYWSGGGTSLNWSDSGNWSSGVPGPADTAWFEDQFYTGYTNAAGLVNNIVDVPTTVGQAIYNPFGVTNTFAPFYPNHYYSTLIPMGSSLMLAGSGAPATPALRVGWDTPSYAAGTVYATVLGQGSMSLANSLATITVSEGATASGTHKATLDMSGLNTFSASLSNLWVGVSSISDRASGGLLLAKTNSITTSANPGAPGILLGRGLTTAGFGSLTLGSANTLNTDGLVVGGARSSFGANFLSFPGVPLLAAPAFTLTVRGSAGGSSRTAVFSIGDSSATETNYLAIANGNGAGSGSSSPSTADFTGGTVDILANNLYVGRNAADNPSLGSGSSAGTAYGNLVFNSGTIDAIAVAVAYKQGTNKSLAVGTLTAKGTATLNVANDLTLAFVTNNSVTASSITAALNVNDSAVVNVGGNVATHGGVATINLAGGTINLTGGGYVGANTLAGYGTITNSSSVTVSNSLTLGVVTTSPVVVRPGTINLGGNLTLQTGVAPKFKLGASTTTGGGINDHLNVGTNLTLNNNNLDLSFVGIPVVGTYDLIDYGGAQSGNFNFIFANTTRNMTFALDQATAQHVQVVVGGGPPASLTWKGGSSGTWDLTNSISWNNNTEKFYTLDNVLFDDTGVQPIISIPSGVTVAPGNITFNNNSRAYTLYSPGKISGYASVTKNGTGTVIWDNSGANDFTGPVNINQGTIQLQTTTYSTEFGATNKLITVASGATLDVYGNSMGAAGGGWPITFSGTGVGGIGAIAHTKPSSGPTIYSPQTTLAGDATVGVATSGLNLILSGSSAPFGGVLDLGGHTLTTTGAGNIGLLNLIATNSGNIQVSSPNFYLRDLILDGSGTITAGARTITLGTLSGTAWTTGYVAKAISIGPGIIQSLGSSTLTIPVSSPISLSGALTVNTVQPIRISGVISGGYGLSKLGAANLVLAGANTYSGATLVSGGVLTLDTTGSLASSPLIRVDSTAVMDVTAQSGSYTVPSGQTVQVDGSASGNLTVPAGATLAGSGTCPGNVTVNGGSLTPGKLDVPRTLTVGNLTLNNAMLTYELDAPTSAGGNVNDLVATTTQLNLTGVNTIKIVPIGSLNTSGGQYTLFTYAGAPLPSSVTNNMLLVSDTRYTFSFVDPAATPGSIQIVVSGRSANPTWQGGATLGPSAWDINTTTNWNNGSNAVTFFNGDTANFDDTALTNRADLVGSLRPASINMANDILAYTFAGTGSLRTGSLTNNGGAGLTIANSSDNTLSGSGLFLNAGSVTFNQPSNAIFTGVLNSSGSGILVKEGTNNLTLVGDSGATFSSPIQVNNGTLLAGWTNAFGSTAVMVTVTNSATLDVNGQMISQPSVAVSGVGIGGLGAINNSGSVMTNALSKVTLNDDATFGAVNRWDIRGPSALFTGNDHKLTKTGAADVWIDTLTDTGLGDVDIQQGRLVFSSMGTDLGDTAKTISVHSNATLGFAYDIAAGAKPVTVAAGGDIEAFANTASPALGTSNSYAGDVTFNGGGVLRIANGAGLTLSGNIHGLAGIINADRGTLTLSGSNDYAGGLTVNLGQVNIANSNSLPAGSTVTTDCTGTPSSDGVWLGLVGDVVTPTSVQDNMISYRTPSGTLNSTLYGEGTWSGPIVMNAVQTDPSQFPAITFSASSNLVIAGSVTQTGAPRLQMNIYGFPGTVRFQSPLVFNGTMTMGSQGLGVDPILTQEYTTMELDSSANSFTNMLFWRGKIIIGADNAIPMGCPIKYSSIVTDNDHRSIIDFHGHVQTFADYPGLADFGGAPAQPTWFGNDSTTADATVLFSSSKTNNWEVWIVDNLNPDLVTPHKTGLSVTSGFLRLPPWSWGAWFDPSAIIAATNNAYTGPTLVTGGTLQVDTTLSNTTTSVSGTGTLAGSGPFYGPIIIGNGGTLSPGGTKTYLSAIGRLTNYNNLTLQAGSKCYMEVNLISKTNDSVVGISNLVYGGTLIITNIGAQAFTNGTVLKLFDAATYTPGTISILPAVPAAGLAWDVSQLAINGTLRVVTTVQPSISGIAQLGDGNIGFTVNGGAGQPYSVRSSTNVALPRLSWPILETGFLPSSSYFYQDLTSTNYPSRFYLISTP